MFEQTFVETQTQTRKPWTVGASLTLQAGLVGIALLMPILHPGVIALDYHPQPLVYVTKLARPPAPPPMAKSPAPRAPHVFNVFTAPTFVPRSISMSPDPAPEAIGIDIPGLGIAGALLTQIASMPVAQPVVKPPPPVDIKPQPATVPIRVSAGTQAAKLMFGPRPVYPRLAISTRTQGTVHLQAVISRDGAIQNLRVVSGPPLLVQAALDAVKQWRYQPTMLSGDPVEVATDIDVHFTLN